MKGLTRTAMFLARRLQWRAEGRQRTSPSVGIAVSGVALAIIVMSVSVAVVLGFKREVKAKLMDIDDSITIAAYDPDGSQRPMRPAEVLELIAPLPDNALTAAHLQTAAILKTADDFVALGLQSSDSRVAPDNVNSVALSALTASRLGLEKGDRIPAYFFIDNRLRMRSLRVDSIFSTGVEEHDAATGYCSAELIRRLLKLDEGEASALGIRNLTQEQIEPLATRIHGDLLSAYYSGETTETYGITTIEQTDAVYFTWLDLLDTNVAVILALMAAVAAFTLISSLFIIILERVKTIGLLKSLGADNRLIRRTFMLMAERLVLKGMLIGNVVALALIALQGATRAVPLDPANYYVDHVPVMLSVAALLALNVGALVLSWLVLMLPAIIISRISPASTMRYE